MTPVPRSVTLLADLRRRSAWYLYRARAMPPQEVPFRVSEQVKRALDRRQVSIGPATPAGSRSDTGLSELIRRWAERPGVAAFWTERSAAAARGEYVVFDRQWGVTPAGLPDWDVDPSTGFRWPPDYCFDVPLHPQWAEPVEVKYVWEINRLVHLLPVAAHAALRQDADVARRCGLELADWIQAHPPRRGVMWRSGIELAHRVLVFVAVLELVGRLGSTESEHAELERVVGQAVAEHIKWIRRYPSQFSSANNHRVTELVGLLIAATAYPQLASTADLDAWWTEFEDVAVRQFHEDGVPAEQATMYAFQVLEWLAIGLSLARRQGRELKSETGQRLARAAEFLATVTDSGGTAVRIGDDDDSRLLTAALPHHDVAAAAVELLTAELEVAPPEPRTGLTTFAAGGYSVWRSAPPASEILWVLDHAPLGMGHLAAHAHADTLAVFLHVGGRPVLVDGGTYLYHAGGSWRDRFRRTDEHNTVAVEGQNSSVIAGPFSWRRGDRAEGRLLAATATGQRWSIQAEHSGYARRFGVVHRRTLEGLGPRSFRLTDRLDGTAGDLAAHWSLLLAPELGVTRNPDGWSVRDGDVELLRLTVPPRWRAAMREETAPYSPAFGVLGSSCRLVIDARLGYGAALSVDLCVPDA